MLLPQISISQVLRTFFFFVSLDDNWCSKCVRIILLTIYPAWSTADTNYIKVASTLPQFFKTHFLAQFLPCSSYFLKQSVRKRAPGLRAGSWLVFSGELQLLGRRRPISVLSWRPRGEKMPRSPQGNYKVYMTGEQLLNFVSSSRRVSEPKAF